MYELKAAKFYIRNRDGLPETEVLDYSRRGFWLLGVETSIFESTTEIYEIGDLSPTVGLAGYIEDVHRALTKLGLPIPKSIDYPEVLTDFLGRSLRQMKLGEIRSMADSYFVKPVQHKIFNGMIWNNDKLSRRLLVTQADDVDVWVSGLINFVSEYRAFILDNQILDCRHYKGDWSKAPDRSIVESAVQTMKGHSPVAYCLDWGVTDDGRTLLVEFNDGYSFGHYGLSPVMVALMISARWHEMASQIYTALPPRYNREI